SNLCLSLHDLRLFYLLILVMLTCSSSLPMSSPPTLISTLFPYTTLFRSIVVFFVIVYVFINIRVGSLFRVSTKQSFRIDNVSTRDRKSTRLNSSHVSISYAVFCLKKKRFRC